MKGWARHTYRRPLLWEWEEEGVEATMCARHVRIVQEEGGQEVLRVKRADKNLDWTRGVDAAPKRVRFQPPLGHVTAGVMSTWMHGRWVDELRKNVEDPRGPDLVVLGCVSLVAEFLLMGYKTAVVAKATRKVRSPELRWIGNICGRWLQRFGPGVQERKKVQDEVWDLQQELQLE